MDFCMEQFHSNGRARYTPTHTILQRPALMRRVGSAIGCLLVRAICQRDGVCVRAPWVTARENCRAAHAPRRCCTGARFKTARRVQSIIGTRTCKPPATLAPGPSATVACQHRLISCNVHACAGSNRGCC